MRRLAFLVAAAALAATPAAHAQGEAAVSLVPSSLKVRYGGTVVLKGRVAGGRDGVAVAIRAQPFTRSAMTVVATARTNAAGRFAVRVRPSIATRYDVRAAGVTSRPVTIGVQPALVLRLTPAGGLRVQARAARGLRGSVVKLQHRTDSGWKTLEKRPLGAGSTTVFPAGTLPSGAAAVRVTMSVNQAGPGYLGARSAPVRVPARWVSLSVSTLQVPFRGGLDLAGRISPARAGLAVGVFARPLPQAEPQRVATVRTDERGRWSYHVPSLPVSTSFQARFGATASRALAVGVRPTIGVAEAAGGGVAVDVDLGAAAKGRVVKLQRRTAAGGWRTLAKLPLDARGEAVFPATVLPGGKATVRVAMSVNQAGAGFLGGFSRPLVLHRAWVSLNPSRFQTGYGESVRLAGRVPAANRGEQVTLLARPFGSSAPATVATLATGADGRWSAEVTPRIATAYTARIGSSASRRVTIGVRPVISVRIVSAARIQAHVEAARSFAGRFVKVQRRLASGAWRTVARLPLGPNSSVAVPARLLPGGTSTLRVSMSVNEAGKGYLGAFSRSFVYQR